MTGNKKYLVDIKSYSTSCVTFGDGAKGKIKGVGMLVCTELSRLNDVFLVEGLTANLIIINQLCNQGLKVNFTKSKCLVTNKKNRVLMRRVRSNDNCYLCVPLEADYTSTWLRSNKDEVKFWHQKRGLLNLQGIKRITYKEDNRSMDPNSYERIFHRYSTKTYKGVNF